MDRMVQTTLNGRIVTLNYSIECMFRIVEKYGDIKTALIAIGEDTREGYEAVKDICVMMANDGELVRRSAGFDPLPMLSEDDVTLRMTPHEFDILRNAVVDAIAIGYNRDTKEEVEEVDVGLQELQQKKTKAEADAPN